MMHVLVTGSDGLAGRAAVRCLLELGHTVNTSLEGTAAGCDAILHCAEALSSDDAAGFEHANVEGTRTVLREAERAGVPRFVLLSCLGAVDPVTPYQRSKAKAEALVREFPGLWTICRAGYAYGPGDPLMTRLAQMVRVLPLIPAISGGGEPFQPVWADDLGEALALVVERGDLGHRTLELAGTDVTTIDDVITELSRSLGKSPRIVSVSAWLAGIGARAADVLGPGLPLRERRIAAVAEPAVIPMGYANALMGELGIDPMPLREGLERLALEIPDVAPDRGNGAMWRRRYWADIDDSAYTTDTLFVLLRDEFGSPPSSVTIDRDAGPVPRTGFVAGETLAMHLPLRGDVPMRVEEVRPHVVTCVMLEGHPVSGAIRFLTEQRGHAMRFEVQSFDRSGSLHERAALAEAGAALMNLTWRAIVERVVQRTGGRASEGIRIEEEKLPPPQVREVETWIENVVRNRRSRPADRRRQSDRRRGRMYALPDRRGLRERRLVARY